MSNLLLLPKIFFSLFLINEIYTQKKARCFMIPDKDSGVSGEVQFYQANENSPVQINMKVYGANAIHGFHIHEYGDILSGCDSAGAHYNPYHKDHGGPNSTVRHFGDFGNVEAKDRTIEVSFNDTVASMYGENNIIGRSCVIHAQKDDLGLGGDEASKKTGNSGARISCGKVQEINSVWPLILGIGLVIFCALFAVWYFVYAKRAPHVGQGDDVRQVEIS